ncbi:hypothetical protein IRY61_06290 [Candidatus Saccharibacteria bacterium]|nr:hypothetical protein [Candidatus Saccharibacteria bacterium]
MRLGLVTWTGNVSAQGDPKRLLRHFLQEIEESMDARPTDVKQLSPPNTVTAGASPIWEFRSSRSRTYAGVIIIRNDVFVGIYLEAPNELDIVAGLHSLKQLARSVRVTDARRTSPDIIAIDVRLPPNTVREHLFQLTPVGTPQEEVYRFVTSPRFLVVPLAPMEAGKVHASKDGFWMELGHYDSPAPSRMPRKHFPLNKEKIRSQISAPMSLPPSAIVKAFWKFNKKHKLRDIEILTGSR